MPNLNQQVNASGTQATIGLGTLEQIKLNQDGTVEIPNLPAKLDADKNIVLGTPVTLSGQTAVDFTGIPATAKKVTVLFGVAGNESTSGYDLKVQLGSSAGIATSGYVGSYFNTDGTSLGTYQESTGVTIILPAGGKAVGRVEFRRIDGNLWVSDSGVGVNNVAWCMRGNAAVTLVDVLTTVRVSNLAGAFTAGTINISWE